MRASTRAIPTRLAARSISRASSTTSTIPTFLDRLPREALPRVRPGGGPRTRESFRAGGDNGGRGRFPTRACTCLPN